MALDSDCLQVVSPFTLSESPVASCLMAWANGPDLARLGEGEEQTDPASVTQTPKVLVGTRPQWDCWSWCVGVCHSATRWEGR